MSKCVYPGLPSHPQHDLAGAQGRGYGGMITFYLNGGLSMAGAFLSALRLFILAESLGAVESLAECPAVMTHASVPADTRAALGISDNMVRGPRPVRGPVRVSALVSLAISNALVIHVPDRPRLPP